MTAPKKIATLNDLLNLAGETAEESGWHEGIPDRTLVPTDHAMWITTKLMLINSELVEAMEELRSGHKVDEVYPGSKGKPEGFPVEIADAVIRVLDLWWTLQDLGWEMPDLGKLIEEKVSFNASRGHKHGNKVI